MIILRKITSGKICVALFFLVLLSVVGWSEEFQKFAHIWIIFLAMFIESLAVLVIMIPVITYVCKTFGFNPVHFGLLVVFATQIGATTLPVAVQLFVATSIAKTPYDQTVRYCFPFVAALLIVLLLCTFFPALTTFIPNMFLGP